MEKISEFFLSKSTLTLQVMSIAFFFSIGIMVRNFVNAQVLKRFADKQNIQLALNLSMNVDLIEIDKNPSII